MWKNINININQIKVETERAMLINCPHNSGYDGYSFWHPSKLIAIGKHSASAIIIYNEDFKFKLIKYGKGKWNSKNIIDEIEISVEEFEKMFEVTTKNIIPKIFKNEYETHKPTEVEPVENNLKDDLKDD